MSGLHQVGPPGERVATPPPGPPPTNLPRGHVPNRRPRAVGLGHTAGCRPSTGCGRLVGPILASLLPRQRYGVERARASPSPLWPSVALHGKRPAALLHSACRLWGHHTRFAHWAVMMPWAGAAPGPRLACGSLARLWARPDLF